MIILNRFRPSQHTLFYLSNGHSKRDSGDLTSPEAIWVADALLLFFVVDRIRKGIGLLLTRAETEAGQEVGDIF